MKLGSEENVIKVKPKERSPFPPHKRSRSRSRSHGISRNKESKGRKSYSRSESYSPSPPPSRKGRRNPTKSISRSPSPRPCRRPLSSSRNVSRNSCLGVFGMSLRTTERSLEQEFMKFGRLQKVKVIRDLETGRSRGFAFVYFEEEEDARMAREAMHGKKEIDGNTIRIDYSIGRRGSFYPRRSYHSNFRDRYDRVDYNSYYRYDGYGKNRRSLSPYIRRYPFSRRSRSRSYSSRR